MNLRGPLAALSACCILFVAVPAAAQSSGLALVESPDRMPALPTRARAPDFRMPDGDLRLAGEPRRNGLIASVPIDERLQVGIGRFRVSEIAQARTHTESDRNAGTMAPRQRSIAGFGLSLRFE
jgi:hypothetical protein